MKTLFIFRRDLRLEDNTALNSALALGEVCPLFIIDKRQFEKNRLRSDNAVHFMLESLLELNRELRKRGSRLSIVRGVAEEVVKEIAAEYEALAINADYTPFSLKRDSAISAVCEREGAKFICEHDALLTAPGSVLTENGRPYRVYSAFAKKARAQKVRRPRTKNGRFSGKGVAGCIGASELESILPGNREIFTNGGRKAALGILGSLGRLGNYSKTRDYPALAGTSGLSPHNKFGTVSIREVYCAIERELGKDHQLISELYWRDFFTHIIFHFPYVLGKPFDSRYVKLRWKKDKKNFSAWKNGRTGFPIVDAGMRELNRSGFMHNRVRMIASSFLVKDLHIDWVEGERYFATRLIDYDPAVNNGNWQWAASTGCDAQPYFRIFNPWLQQKRYDPDCEYIKKWVPELSGLKPKDIHSGKWGADLYVRPIVDHKKESGIAKQEYRKAIGKA